MIIFAIAVSAIVFFLPKDKSAESKEDFGVEIIAQDLSVEKGKTVENFYTLSRNDAEVSFEIEMPDLVRIDDNDLTALKQGQTSITIFATVGESHASCTIEIKITDDKRVVISAVEECEIENGKIIAKSEIFAIQIEFFDSVGKLDNFTYNISCQDASVKFNKQVTSIVFKSKHDFSFEISFDGDTTRKIDVVFVG